VVRALIERVEEISRGIKIEAAWVISPRPLFRHKGQRSIFADGKDCNAVVQTVARINKLAVAGNHNLRAEIAASESRRQAGEGLLRGERSLLAVEIEEDDVRAFFLQAVEPALLWVKRKMARSIAGRNGNAGGGVGRQLAGLFIELPDEDL